MGKLGRKYAISLILVMVLFVGTTARAEATKEFITSCTYGVLAGTLVGAASLAFTDAPGDNLNNIARGASLGLYAGILLGAYIVYGVSDGSDPESEEESADEATPPDEQTRVQSIYPLFSKAGYIDGAAVQMKVWSF